MRRLKRILTFLLGSLGVLLLLYVLIGGWAASRMEERTAAAWRTVPGAIGDFATAFPELQASPSALDLERLTALLGLDISSKLYDRPADASPPEEMEEGFPAVRLAVRDYVRIEIEAERGVASAAPPEVAAYLDSEATRLAAIEDHLLGSDPPVWERDVALGMAAPLPNLLGHLNLQQLLAARALHLAAASREREAQRSLDAARRHAAFLADRPELLGTLIGMAVARLHHGVLRKLPGGEAERLDELAREDWRPRVLRGLEFEAWGFSTYARTAASTTAQGLLESTYIRFCAADHSRVVREALTDLVRTDGCTNDPERVNRSAEAAFAFWNVPGKIALGRLATPWVRATRAALDAELTAIVLETRQAAAASGTWVPPAPRTCAACPGRRFVHAMGPGGAISIRLEPPLPRPVASRRGTLPTAWVAPPGPPPAVRTWEGDPP